MTLEDEYKQFKSKSMIELRLDIARREGDLSKTQLARLALEEKELAVKHEYVMSQIEFQHDKNLELLKKQLAKQEEMLNAQIKSQSQWMKFSVIITAISTLSAAIAGALVAHMLHISELRTMRQPDKPQIIQYQSESSPGFQAPAAKALPSVNDAGKQKK